MEIIYIDRLFLLNLIIDYLLCLGSAKVCGAYLRRLRYLFAALFGAALSALSIFPALSFLSLAPLKLAEGIIMALIAYGREEKFFRCCAVFFAVSAFFGGAVWALSVQSGLYSDGRIYVPLSFPVLALAFALCYALLSFTFRRTAKNAGRQIKSAQVAVGLNSVLLRVLADSGNSLFDPISGASVMIASPSALRPLFPGIELSKSPAELCTQMAGSRQSWRLIPYNAVGTDGGLLAAFRPDKLIIGGKERDDIILAVSANEIDGDGFNAISDI